MIFGSAALIESCRNKRPPELGLCHSQTKDSGLTRSKAPVGLRRTMFFAWLVFESAQTLRIDHDSVGPA